MNSIIRQSLRYLYLSSIGSFKKPSNGIHILNGHMVHRTKPDLQIFNETMSALSKHVSFIRIEDAIKMIIAHDQPDVPLVAFTFDDGLMECSTMIAPILESYKTNGLFFVNPGFIEGDEKYIEQFTNNVIRTPNKSPMRWDEIRKLNNNGHIIGAHTIDHYLINSNNKEELKHQIIDCKTILEERLESPCDYFAFPFGTLHDANQYSIELACSTYKFVFSQSDYKHYFSFNGKVINRRHFEPFWPVSHINYFLSKHISY